MKPREVQGKTFAELSEITFDRIRGIGQRYSTFEEVSWKKDFVTSCEKKKKELEEAWQVNWRDECDGKRLISNLLFTSVSARSGGPGPSLEDQVRLREPGVSSILPRT